MPAAELAGQIPDGADVIGQPITRLREHVISAADWSARFGLIGDFFRQRAAHSAEASQPRPEAIEAWKWLARMRGAGSISGLADHVGLSRRQLQTVFAAEFGIGPTVLRRLLRFQRALRTITDRVDHHQPLDLTGIAAACGYFDQSHFNRDFRSLTGTSPTGWLAEEFDNVRAGGHRNGDDV
jgi:AraC-like DNA-binding protein